MGNLGRLIHLCPPTRAISESDFAWLKTQNKGDKTHMALTVKKQIACPVGPNRGIVTSARETTKVFDPRTGPEAVVEVTIQPAHRVEGFETMSVSVVFASNLSTLGGLYAFLKRIGHEPKGESFNVESIDGTEVVFLAASKNNFINVQKDSIRAP